MSEFDKFLEEQMKSEEFRREFEALAPDYELVLRGDVDPRNLAFPIKMDGTEYSDYERGYNDGVIAAYWLTRSAKAMNAEPVTHAHWEFYEDETGDWWDKCSGCGGKLPNEGGYCCGLPRCPHCGAHMDEKLELRTCYCPICDKHFKVHSNDSMGDCPDCGHHVVLHKAEVADGKM